MGLQNAGDMVGALILGIGSGLIGWIIGAVFAAIFGAVGGLLYVAIQGNKAPRPA
jgi:membrane associated rhomboid family serine protease